MAADTAKDSAIRRGVLTACIALIAGAELCIALIDVVGGAIAYSIVLVGMLSYSSIHAHDDEEPLESQRQTDLNNAITALSLVPVLRLISLSVPLTGRSEAAQYVIVGGPLLAGIAWGVWQVGLPGIALRSRFFALDLAIAWFGFPFAFFAYFLLRPDSVAEGSQWTQLASASLAVSLAAVVEELIFRGLIGAAFVRMYGSSAPLWSTAVYVVSYLGVHPPRMIALAVVLGLLFSWAVARTGSMLGVTASHAIINIGLLVFLPPAPPP